MRTTSRWSALGALALGLSLSFTSCKDNDLADGGSHSGSDSEQIDEQTAQRYNALQCLLGALAEVDSLPSNWNDASYKVSPTIGVASSEATPSVRLIATANAEEADREFRSMIAANVSGAAKDTTWTMNGIGSLSFKVAHNDPSLYATLSVNVQQVPGLEEIRFVPATAIGDNGIKSTYYQFGDVVRQEIDGRMTYWVCVRPASVGSKLGKSHWCTFQLVPSNRSHTNFKQLGSKSTPIYLPTDLGSSESECARMVQNFFNVLRIAANPSRMEEVVNLDKIPLNNKDNSKNEFTQTNARDLAYYWNYQDLWNNVLNPEFQKDDFKTFIGSTNYPELNAFYYGYNKVFWGNGDYRLYNLHLGLAPNEKNGTLFNSVTKSTPWLNSDISRDFSVLEKGCADYNSSVSIDGGAVINFRDHCYIVKCRTGAQLEGAWGYDDKDCSKSFMARPSNGITDVFVLKKELEKTTQNTKTPFFAFGDRVTRTSDFEGSQMCIKEACTEYKSLENDENALAYFICDPNGKVLTDVTKQTTVSEPVAKIILYNLMQSYVCARELNIKNFQSVEVSSSDELKNAYKIALRKIYTNLDYFKGISVTGTNDDDNELTLTAQLGGTKDAPIYRLIFDKEKSSFKFSKINENIDLYLKPLAIYAYKDDHTYTETYSEKRDLISESYDIRFLLQRYLCTDIETVLFR